MADHTPDGHDREIERIADALRPLPVVDPQARARVLVAVAAERRRAAGREPARRRRASAVVGGLLAAGLVIGIAVAGRGRGASRATDRGEPVSRARGEATAGAATLAADAGAGFPAGSRSVQLVIRAPGAHRVAVVGDFTGWDDNRIAMQRDPASGLWSAIVRVKPGRHVYAYVADDTLWMRDPRAPVAEDPDFGRPGSLLLVGRP